MRTIIRRITDTEIAPRCEFCIEIYELSSMMMCDYLKRTKIHAITHTNFAQRCQLRRFIGNMLRA